MPIGGLQAFTLLPPLPGYHTHDIRLPTRKEHPAPTTPPGPTPSGDFFVPPWEDVNSEQSQTSHSLHISHDSCSTYFQHQANQSNNMLPDCKINNL